MRFTIYWFLSKGAFLNFQVLALYFCHVVIFFFLFLFKLYDNYLIPEIQLSKYINVSMQPQI